MKQDDPLARARWLLERSGDAALVTDATGHIEYVNPAFEAMTGYGRDEAIGRTPAIVKSGHQSPEFYQRLWSLLREGREFHGVLVNRRRDGALFHEEKSIRPLFDEHGAISHFLSSGRDVSERIAALDRLHHEATHDALTGLPNRALFLDRLRQALAQARRSAEAIAVLVIDLDGFKAINDRHGHAAGDTVLREAARRLSACIREADTAARFGGDEFVLMLRDAGDAGRVGSAVIRSCAEPVTLDDGATLSYSVSVGLCISSPLVHDAQALIDQADRAMYRAKREGGGRTCSAQPSSHAALPAAPGGANALDALLAVLGREAPVLRRSLHPKDVIYRMGDRFRGLHILRTGLCKVFGLGPGGREELTTLLFKGDWLGFDGLADGRQTCTAVAADVGELWTIPYDAILRVGARHPEVMTQMHAALARQGARERDAMLTMYGLPVDARVAAFLCRWADELQHCGLRTDRIALAVTRAEIGGHLGMRLETVSRAMSQLDRMGLIRFSAHGRRDIEIPDMAALRDFVRHASEAAC